ncbi:MAG: IMP dehydrogenase, partial [bacterium]
MAEWIGIGRRARICYGFDEVALVPGSQTINPNEVNTAFLLGNKKFSVPILAAAMDGVVDVRFAVEMSRLGGIAVLNLDGIQTRYEEPDLVLEKIASATPAEATALTQSVYTTPIKEKLIAKRVKQIKAKKGTAVVSCIPAHAQRFSKIAVSAGADIFVVQSTVTSTRHISKEYKSLDLFKFCKDTKIPVLIGNCVTYETTLELMETGAAGLLIGVGP